MKGILNIVQDLIPLSTPKNRRPGTKRTVTCIVVHNTADPKGTARNERNWLVNPTNDREASFNYAVDDIEQRQVIPDLEVTWNATDGHGEGNIHGLSIEVCEVDNYAQAEANAITLIALKMIIYGLTIDKVLPHQHFYPVKYCPHIILPYWADFIARVQAEYNLQKGVKPMPTPVVTPVVPVVVPVAQWKIDERNKLIARGVPVSEERYDDAMTRAEGFALANKILDVAEKLTQK